MVEIASRLKWFVVFAMFLALAGCAGKTVSLGEQVWMSNNANKNVEGARCYRLDSGESTCAENYMVYNWNGAQKACPTGYHLPSINEFRQMEEFRKNNKNANAGFCFGLDKSFDGGLCYETAFSAYWTSSELDKKSAFVWDVELNYANLEPRAQDKNDFYSVRCIAD